MRRWIIYFALSTAVLSCRCEAAEKRVALVIGNSAYLNTKKLTNPLNDATKLKQALANLGFDVDLVIDSKAPELALRVAAFLEKFKDADVGLFYYAGHGLQYKDQNLIVGVDARLKSPLTLRYETFPLNEVIRNMDSYGKTSLIFWDACRDNPLAEKLKKFNLADFGTGAAAIDGAVGNTLIVFATKPNEVAYDGAGSHSPFTNSLLKHIVTPGLEISQVLNRVTDDVVQATAGQTPPQRPERQASMTRDFYFSAASSAPPPPDDMATKRIAELESRIRDLEGTTRSISPDERPADSAVKLEGIAGPQEPSNGPPDKGDAGQSTVAAIEPAASDQHASQSQTLVKPNLKDAYTLRSLAISPDGSLLAAVGDDGHVRIWSLNTLKLEKILEPPHRDKGYAVAFSDDGRLIASGGWDGAVEIWSVQTGALLKKIDNRGDKIYSLAFLNEKKNTYILGGRRSGNSTTWKLKEDRYSGVASNPGGHSGPVHAISFEPRGEGTYISGGGEGNIIWRSSRGGHRTFKAHDGAVFDVEYAATGAYFVSTGYDRKIKIWDARTLALLRTFIGHTRYVLAVAVSHDGKFIASAGGDKTIRLWSVETGELVRIFEGHRQDVEDVYFSPGGAQLVSISEDKTMRVWDTASGHELALLAVFPDNQYVALASDGRFTGTDGAYKHLRIIDKGFEDDMPEGYRSKNFVSEGLRGLLSR